MARECFEKQDYPRKELLEEDSPESIGAKRNRLCQRASSEIIIHWDDDDWSDPHRITFQMEKFMASPKKVGGFNAMFYFEVAAVKAWLYENPSPYALGTSLCYLHSWWRSHPFSETVKRGEDTIFVREAKQFGELESDYTLGLIVARSHGINQPRPKFNNQTFSRLPTRNLPREFRKAQGIR
jgi:hypothetical protein